jgi:hypothetical protein
MESPNTCLLKTLWHVGLAAAAAYEAVTAETRVRKLMAGAAAGWHVVAAMDDLKDFRQARQYRLET